MIYKKYKGLDLCDFLEKQKYVYEELGYALDKDGVLALTDMGD